MCGRSCPSGQTKTDCFIDQRKREREREREREIKDGKATSSSSRAYTHSSSSFLALKVDSRGSIDPLFPTGVSKDAILLLLYLSWRIMTMIIKRKKHTRTRLIVSFVLFYQLCVKIQQQKRNARRITTSHHKNTHEIVKVNGNSVFPFLLAHGR